MTRRERVEDASESINFSLPGGPFYADFRLCELYNSQGKLETTIYSEESNVRLFLKGTPRNMPAPSHVVEWIRQNYPNPRVAEVKNASLATSNNNANMRTEYRTGLINAVTG